VDIYRITQKGDFSRDYGFKDQIRRAAVSIASNLAEGDERGSNKDSVRFFYIAKGSLAEVQTQLEIAKEINYIDEQHFKEIDEKCIILGKMIGSLIKSRSHNLLPMSLIKQNIIANFGGKAWTALMSLAFVPLYIKFMGIESYGLVGIFASLLALFGILDMGLSTTLNREMARLSALPDKAREMRNLVRTLELPYWAVAVFIGIAVICLSGPIAHYWVKADKLTPATVKQALMIMGGVVAFRWPVSLYSGGLMGLQKQVLLNGINVF